MDYKLEHKLKLAREFETNGKFLHAVQIYHELIKEFPDSIEPYVNLADIYQFTGHKKSAEKVLKLIIDRQPDNYEIQLYYIQLLMQNKDWGRALTLLSKLSSDDPFISYLTGYCYFQQSDFEHAKVHLLNFIISDEEPELIQEAYFILAKLEFELYQYESALKYAKKAEIMYNDDSELYLLFSRVYYYLKMYTHSSDSILKAIKLNENDAVLYEWAGKINLKLDNFIKAKNYFKKHIDLKDNVSSDDYTSLANACLKTCELHEALNYFDTAIKLDPENQSAHEGKGKTNDLLKKQMASDV